jgi:hypothetical protein
MTPGKSPTLNTGPIPIHLVYTQFSFCFNHLQGYLYVFSILFALVAAAALYSGAPWLFSFALTALLATIFPVFIVLLVIGAVAVWVIHHYRK